LKTSLAKIPKIEHRCEHPDLRLVRGGGEGRSDAIEMNYRKRSS
jgi:hypothetical protein